MSEHPPKTSPGDPEPLAQPPADAVRRAQEERLLDAWRTPTGWRYWSAVNNSEVGLWYTASTFFFLLFAGVLALIMRVQLAVPKSRPHESPATSKMCWKVARSFRLQRLF